MFRFSRFLAGSLALLLLVAFGVSASYADDEFVLENDSDGAMKCLIYGSNGQDTYPSRYTWGASNYLCGFPGDTPAFEANRQGLWILDQIDGSAYMLKNNSHGSTQCLIFGGNGTDKYPTLYDWGHDNEYCGFPGGESALRANRQAVWYLIPLRGDSYMIKSAADGVTKCLIFGGNGTDKFPSLYDWGAGNPYCGFPGGLNALLANKQAVWHVVAVP